MDYILLPMEMTRVHLLRHGQVAGYREKRYNGQGDVSLTDHGREQSEALAARLAEYRLKAVYTSDLVRCRSAAERIARRQELAAVVRRDLRELDVGTWEGRTWQELQREDPELWRARLADIVHVAPPGGETVLEMARRVRPVIREIATAHAGDEVAIVAHGGVNRVVLLDALGAPLDSLFRIEQDYGCHNVIDYFPDGTARVKQLNG